MRSRILSTDPFAGARRGSKKEIMDKDVVEAIAKDAGMSFGVAVLILLLAGAIGAFIYFAGEEKPIPADDDITIDGVNYYHYEDVLFCLQNPDVCRQKRI